MNKDTILITGGAGFIGNCLVRRCRRAGLRVVVLDNFSFGKLAKLPERDEGVAVIRADVRDHTAVQMAFRDCAPQLVVHLAALHYIPYCDAHPEETIAVNVQGTFSVLEAAAAAGVNRVVIASTGAIYVSSTEPLDEYDSKVSPCDVYGLSKQLSEMAAEYVSRRSVLPVTIARLFNVYGPGETNPHLIPHLVEHVKSDTLPVPLGNVHTKRDFVFVSDVAEALFQLVVDSDRRNAVYNIGTGYEASASELVAIIGELLGRHIGITSVSDRVRQVDKEHQIARIARVVGAVGWVPKHDLRTGLSELLIAEGLLEAARQ